MSQLLRQSFADFPNSFRRDLELDGMSIIEPDGQTFESFSLKHWHLASFLARRDNKIYVPLVHARKPHHGALSRLCLDIRAKGLTIAVIAPLGEMETILKNWLFESRRELICMSVEDVWYEAA